MNDRSCDGVDDSGDKVFDGKWFECLFIVGRRVKISSCVDLELDEYECLWDKSIVKPQQVKNDDAVDARDCWNE